MHTDIDAKEMHECVMLQTVYKGCKLPVVITNNTDVGMSEFSSTNITSYLISLPFDL